MESQSKKQTYCTFKADINGSFLTVTIFKKIQNKLMNTLVFKLSLQMQYQIQYQTNA